MKKKNSKMLLDTNDKPPLLKWILLSLQHVFAMFGATILVPILVNSKAGSEVLSIPVAYLYFMYERKKPSIFRKFICIYCTYGSSSS